MRHLIGTYLKTGRLFRRYLQFPLCRQSRVLGQPQSLGLQHQPKHHSAAGALFRRGLTLGWAYAAAEPSLLDIPHAKAYRLAFDGRLYQSKCRVRLEARTRLQLKTAISQLKPLSTVEVEGWNAGSFSIELGTWGEKTGHSFRLWASCDRLAMRAVLGGTQSASLSWRHLQPWRQLAWSWAQCSWLRVSAVGTPPLWSDALWRVPHIETDEARADWIEGAGILEGPDFVSFLTVHTAEAVDVGLRAASNVQVPVTFAPSLGSLVDREAARSIWMFYLESAGIVAAGVSSVDTGRTPLTLFVTGQLHLGVVALIS